MGKPSKEQKEMMDEWQGMTGFEFMHIDEVTAKNKKGFVELFQRNLDWLTDVVTEADGIINEYRNKYGQ